MRRLFADASYWIALANPRDQHHRTFLAASRSLGRVHLVTTDEVLSELLAYCGGRGPGMRRLAVRTIENLFNDPLSTIVPQTRASFLDGLALYRSRPDKGYSLTDCISMVTMRREGLSEVLTRDAHFAQEGFALVP
jgi:predicted nucleic acid-binding protein